jgi:thioredoxin 1
MMAPVMEEIARKFKGKIKFGKVNIEDNQELAQKFRIVSLPTFMLFKDGKQADQFVGSRSIEDFEEKLKSLL